MRRKQRSDGRVQAKVYVGEVDGKKKYKYVYGKTNKEVNQKVAELKVALGKGVDLTQPMTLSFWIDRWLARTEQKLTGNWYEVCRSRAEYWRDALGDEDVSRLTTADLEDVLITLAKKNPKTKKPTAKKTLVEYRNIISRIFAYIAQQRVITFDPASYLTVDKTAPTTHRTAVSNAVVTLIANTEDPIRLSCLVMVYAGLRLGEASALTWSDVDLKAQTISVTKSLDFKTRNVKPPKTAAGVRTVPIPPPLLSALKEAPRTSLLVCCRPDGRPWSTDSWRYAIERYNKKLGTSFDAHSLRHTCCTMYYEAGVDVLTAQKWMGHADPSTTMKIYTHLRESHQQQNVVKLTDYFKGVSDGCQSSPKTSVK